MGRRQSLIALAALAAGLAVGVGLERLGDPALAAAVEPIRALGALWLDALRMTIVPLIFALMVGAVGLVADAAATGRTAVRALALFAVMVTGAAFYAIAAVEGLLTVWPVDPAAAAAFVASAPPAGEALLSAGASPSLARFLENVAPSNVVRAAGEEQILQLVVFALIFGLAVTRLPEHQRAAATGLFSAVAEAMIIVVRWVLLAAPVGVFGLALGVGLTAGADAASLLVQYVVIVSLVTAGITVIAFGIGAAAGGVGPAAFARAAAPVWAVAASTQSSLASLPAMVERLEDHLRVRAATVGLVLPLGVTLFRISSPVANLSVAFFVAALYGHDPSAGQIAAAVLTALVVSVGTVGLPGQISFFASMAPICLALGAPLETLAILLAVEVIPDIFRTLGNVNGHMAAALVVERTTPQKGD